MFCTCWAKKVQGRTPISKNVRFALCGAHKVQSTRFLKQPSIAGRKEEVRFRRRKQKGFVVDTFWELVVPSGASSCRGCAWHKSALTMSACSAVQTAPRHERNVTRWFRAHQQIFCSQDPEYDCCWGRRGSCWLRMGIGW